MKRALPFLLILALICMQLPYFLAVPAQAATTENDFGMDLIDYSTVNDSGSNFFSFTDTKTINIDIPNSYYTTYVDVVFNVTGGPVPTSVQSKWGSTYNDLTILSIGRGYYRAFGNVRVSTYYSLDLVFTTGSTALTYIEIMSCVIHGNFTHFEIPGAMMYDYNSQSGTAYYYPGATPYPMTPVYITSPSDMHALDFNLFFYSNDWLKYDYLDFYIYAHCQSISSVSCSFGDIVVPCEISYLDNSNFIESTFIFSVRIDCRGLDRTSSDYPMLIVNGSLFNDTSLTNTFQLLGCGGFIEFGFDDPTIPWFQKILAKIVSNNSAILGAFSALNSDLNSFSDRVDASFSSLSTVVEVFSDEVATAFSTLNGVIDIFSDTVVEQFTNQNNVLGIFTNRIIEQITNQNNVITILHGRLIDALESYFGSSGKGEEVKNEAAQMKDNMSSSNAELNSLSKPSGNDISAVDSLGAVSFTGNTSYLTQIVNTKYIKDVFVFVAVLSVISLVLFGVKKGG